MTKGFYNEKGAAEWFGVSQKTIAKWRKTRRLGHCRTEDSPGMFTKNRVPGNILYSRQNLIDCGKTFTRFPAQGG